MSYWGTWKCPKCKRKWRGGIGWKWPTNLDKFLEKLCGCTDKKLTNKEWRDAKIITFHHPIPNIKIKRKEKSYEQETGAKNNISAKTKQGDFESKGQKYAG